MNIVNLISDINPISVPGLLKLAEKNKNDNTVEPFETVEDGNFGVLGIIVPCICCILALYINYMQLKCYCGDYIKYLLVGLFYCCCPLCAVPYIFYQYFGKKCGRGQIGLPN